MGWLDILKSVASDVRKADGFLRQWGKLSLFHAVLLVALFAALAIAVAYIAGCIESFVAFEFTTDAGKVNAIVLLAISACTFAATIHLMRYTGHSWPRRMVVLCILLCVLLYGGIHCVDTLSGLVSQKKRSPAAGRRKRTQRERKLSLGSSVRTCWGHRRGDRAVVQSVSDSYWQTPSYPCLVDGTSLRA